MAHTITTLKRARQNETRRLHNRAIRSAIRTQVKKVLTAVEQKDANAARTAFQAACSTLDKAAKGGVLHRNAAARNKSRLAARVQALAAAPKK